MSETSLKFEDRDMRRSVKIAVEKISHAPNGAKLGSPRNVVRVTVSDLDGETVSMDLNRARATLLAAKLAEIAGRADQ